MHEQVVRLGLQAGWNVTVTGKNSKQKLQSENTIQVLFSQHQCLLITLESTCGIQ